MHLLIEERGLRFLLTGSGARKLRRGGVNLLGAGRAYWPCTRSFGRNYRISASCTPSTTGCCPSSIFSDEPEQGLAAYAGMYLQEEVAAEGLARNIPAFSRFLEVAALCNGTLLNYANIANDAQRISLTACGQENSQTKSTGRLEKL